MKDGIITATLVQAVRQLGLEAEVALSGQWIKLEGERCPIYVVEATWGSGYYVWCEDRQDRVVDFVRHPVDALRLGLRRAANRPDERPKDAP